jgi:hypothetical protein
MNLDDRLALIRVKVKWAKKHLGDLEVARDRFIETKPYVIESEREPHTGNDRFYVTKLQPPPLDIGLIAGDAIHNLRSALDYLAYQLVLINHRTPNGQTGFPIFEDAARYEAHRSGKVEGMAQSAIDAIDDAKPYRGGNNILWLIHRLDIADKHHALPTTLIHVGQWTVKLPVFGRFYLPSDDSPPLEEGDVIFTCEPNVHENVEFAFDITLAKPELFAGVPLLPTLQKAADRVDSLILGFRDELS